MAHHIVSFGLSDRGRVRQNNEDAWAALDDLFFYVLADGMGGHRAGEVASREAVQNLCRIAKEKFVKKNKMSFSEAAKTIQSAFLEVNHIVYTLGKTHERWKGMGTTLCCIYIHAEGVICGHVGDSRIYRLRNKKLEQLSTDHSLLRELMDLGQLSEQHGLNFLYKNIITRAIGTEAEVEPAIITLDYQPKDSFLMCTDGLSDFVNPEEIEAILNKSKTPEIAAKHLVDTANERGGFDNITVVLVQS